jgi:hypothetical protein
MAEGFELVRTLRQHLRRGAALLDEGKLDEALVEVDAALALDAESLPAQTLRERIERAKQAPASPQISAIAPAPARPSSFVPHGVNAASWHGFEQRIQERRFRALLETVNTALVAGDAARARAALDEARELRPNAPELAGFDARVAASAVAPLVSEPMPAPRIWMRAMGAAAMLTIGVSMLLGLEWMRPSQPIAADVAPVSAPVLRPAETGVARMPDVESAPVAIEEDESVPAIVTPPEPTLQPRGTTGATPPLEPPSASRPVARVETPVAPPPSAPTVEARRAVLEEPIARRGEVPDDYVTQPPATRAAVDTEVAHEAPARAAMETEVVRPPDARAAVDNDASRQPLPHPTPGETARAPVQAARMPETTVPTPISPGPTPTAAAVVPAAIVSPREETRVQEVLRRYARAYGELDASAAAAVWPSVDEKALARAFKDLASQNLSFDDCEIDIRGSVANASCRGMASYVGKVGSREPRIEPRTWRFELRRDGEAWKIENAEARRLSATSASYR